MTNLGPHALEKLAPGGTVDVIFWEKDIARELTELTQHTYMDPITGQRFRLEITSGPQSVPRTAAPFSPGEGVPSNVRVAPPPIRGTRVLVQEAYADGALLGRLAALVDENKLTLRVAETFPISDAARAHTRLEARGVRGRLVLVP